MLTVNTESFYKRFPAFHLTNEVNELVQPFFRTTNANYFDYCRFYEDNSFFTLTTDCLWLEHFFRKQHRLAPDFKTSGKHLWNSTYYNGITHDARAYFNHDHGIRIFYKRANYIEFIDIAAPQDHHGMTSVYLNNFDYIENFILEFVEKAGNLITQAESQLVFIPTVMCDLKKIDLKQTNTFYTSSKRQLTEREKDCLENFLRGHTAKETAIELQISPRTVEHHLNNIKMKFECRKKRELIKLLQSHKREHI